MGSYWSREDIEEIVKPAVPPPPPIKLERRSYRDVLMGQEAKASADRQRHKNKIDEALFRQRMALRRRPPPLQTDSSESA